jgi:hypothetical protein
MPKSTMALPTSPRMRADRRLKFELVSDRAGIMPLF